MNAVWGDSQCKESKTLGPHNSPNPEPTRDILPCDRYGLAELASSFMLRSCESNSWEPHGRRRVPCICWKSMTGACCWSADFFKASVRNRFYATAAFRSTPQRSTRSCLATRTLIIQAICRTSAGKVSTAAFTARSPRAISAQSCSKTRRKSKSMMPRLSQRSPPVRVCRRSNLFTLSNKRKRRCGSS